MRKIETEKKAPLVSVIMSVYKEPVELIRAAMESILRQSFLNLELIVCSDCPDRGAIHREIFAEFEDDKRARFLFNEVNLGLGFSLNRCVDISDGFYIARMDADDLCSKERIAKQVDYEKSLGAGAAVFSGVVMLRANGEEFERKMPPNPNFKKHFFRFDPFVHATMLVEKDVLKKARYLLSKPPEDWDLFLRLYGSGTKFFVLAEPLYIYRFDAKDEYIDKSERRARASINSINALKVLCNNFKIAVRCDGFFYRATYSVFSILLASNIYTYQASKLLMSQIRQVRGR